MLIHVISLDDKTVGWVYVRSDAAELWSRLVRYAGLVVAVVLASLLAGLIIAGQASSSVARPMVELAAIARTVERERDYSIRVPSGSDVEEVAALRAAFNGMLAEIETRDASLTRGSLELENRVQHRTEELASANRNLEAFSYSVSHDLRAPLRTIAGFSHVLFEDYGPQLDEEARRVIGRIVEGTATMGTLIDDLLRLGRATSDPLELSEVDLAEVAAEVVEELRAQDPAREVDVVIAANLQTYGDRRLLRVALVNLLGNSWKYTARHGRARIEVGRLDGYAAGFFVRDDGAGFNPEYSAQLFTPFRRLHAPGDFAGSGIGLAIVQRIILRHGGRIWAKAESSAARPSSSPSRLEVLRNQIPPQPVHPELSSGIEKCIELDRLADEAAGSPSIGAAIRSRSSWEDVNTTTE